MQQIRILIVVIVILMLLTMAIGFQMSLSGQDDTLPALMTDIANDGDPPFVQTLAYYEAQAQPRDEFFATMTAQAAMTPEADEQETVAYPFMDVFWQIFGQENPFAGFGE